MTPEALLALIQVLLQKPAFEVASLEGVVGGKLVANESTAFADEHVATDAPGWSRVWLQLPKGTATFQPRLSLTPDPGMCATRDQATARFGFAAKVPVHPGHRPPAEEWWQYPEVKTLRLSLGFDPKTGCLVTANLQRL